MVKVARATKIESARPEIPNVKQKLEEILSQQSVLQLGHQIFLKPKDEELENAMLLLYEVTQDCLSYVEPLNPYVEEMSAGLEVTFQDLYHKTIFPNPEERLDQTENRVTIKPEVHNESGNVSSQV